MKRKAPRPPSPSTTVIESEAVDSPTEVSPVTTLVAEAGSTIETPASVESTSSPDGICPSKPDDFPAEPLNMDGEVVGRTSEEKVDTPPANASADTPPSVTPVWSPAEAMAASDLETSEDEMESQTESSSQRTKEAFEKTATTERSEFVNDKGVTFRTVIPKNDGKLLFNEELSY